jgi:hypothetical protein
MMKLAAGRRVEVAIGYIDRDALLALGLESIGEQREIDRAIGAIDLSSS